jgi:hypothetical protein
LDHPHQAELFTEKKETSQALASSFGSPCFKVSTHSRPPFSAPESIESGKKEKVPSSQLKYNNEGILWARAQEHQGIPSATRDKAKKHLVIDCAHSLTLLRSPLKQQQFIIDTIYTKEQKEKSAS